MKQKETKKIFGICRVGEKGQIVIPKEARTLFNINPGDSVVLLGDVKKGIAVVKAEVFESVADGVLKGGE